MPTGRAAGVSTRLCRTSRLDAGGGTANTGRCACVACTGCRSNRSVVAALIVMARFLADKDPGVATFLQGILQHAEAVKLTGEDPAALRLVIGSLRG